jgi:hypothetical protein
MVRNVQYILSLYTDYPHKTVGFNHVFMFLYGYTKTMADILMGDLFKYLKGIVDLTSFY